MEFLLMITSMLLFMFGLIAIFMNLYHTEQKQFEYSKKRNDSETVIDYLLLSRK